jgi:hypothetical protein
MRVLFAVALAAALIGCDFTSTSSSESTTTNPDGSTTTTKTETKTVNGRTTGTKTETTLARDGKLTVKKYEKSGGDWSEVR